MRCSVVFGVTLRLFVITFSSSSPAINTAAYYQRYVITCETVAVVHRQPYLQHLACCSVNTGSQARYRLRIAISAYHTCIRPFDAPVRGRGFPSEYCYAVWHGKKLEWRGYPTVKIILMICGVIFNNLEWPLTQISMSRTHGVTVDALDVLCA